MTDASIRKEALRQQMLLRALWGDARPEVVRGWLRDQGTRATRGLQAYRANAGALAERALAAAFPTIAQLVGDESFGALARAFWHAEAPHRGDLADWGAALPAFIAAAPQLAEEAYLGDVAALDWAVHAAEQAHDGTATPAGLERLATGEPAQLGLRLAAGSALVSSAYPVVTIWQAHRSSAADRFAPVRAAFACGVGERAFVWRRGFRAEVSVVDEPTARFTRAVLDGRTLEIALDRAGPGFAFEPWLLLALRQGSLAAVVEGPSASSLPPTPRP